MRRDHGAVAATVDVDWPHLPTTTWLRRRGVPQGALEASMRLRDVCGCGLLSWLVGGRLSPLSTMAAWLGRGEAHCSMAFFFCLPQLMSASLLPETMCMLQSPGASGDIESPFPSIRCVALPTCPAVAVVVRIQSPPDGLDWLAGCLCLTASPRCQPHTPTCGHVTSTQTTLAAIERHQKREWTQQNVFGIHKIQGDDDVGD